MKNNYSFIYNNGELKFVQKQIKKYKTKYFDIRSYYDKKLEKIDDYINMIKLMEEYRLKVLKLLKSIIKSYVYFENNAIIYLTGSFARNTVRTFSDLDLNIVYINGSGENYKEYEELFYYMISEIFNYPRRAVHSIITAFNNKTNIKYVQNNMDDENIKITLKDNDYIIKYEIPSTSKKRFYLQYINDKNYKTVFKNLKSIYDVEGIKEWSNNFLFLNKNKLVNECYNDYISYILKNTNRNRIKDFYYQIIKSIENKDYDFSYLKNIKLAVQMEELYFIYNSVTILQLLNIINSNKEFYNSFKKLFKNKNPKIKELVKIFYKYNYKLIHLNKLFEIYNLEYSIHTNNRINLKKYPLLMEAINNIMIFRTEINKKILKILEEEVCI